MGLSLAVILLSLVLLVIVQRKTRSIFYAIFAAIAVVVIFRWDGQAFLTSLIEPFIDMALYRSVIPVFLIFLFSDGLSHSRDDYAFSQSVQNLFDRKTSVAFMPLMIGFLPMPGGAMFTAPIVKMVDNHSKGDYLVLANFWFRHAVEFFWPLYPALIIICSLASINIAAFSIQAFPIFLVAVAGGWIYLNGFSLPKMKKSSLRSLRGLWVLLVIAVTGILILGFRMEGYLALLITVGLYFCIRYRALLPSMKKTAKRYAIFFLLFSFFAYKSYLEQVHLASDIANDLSRLGLHLSVLTFFLPFVIGLATGITQSAVGISAPLLLVLGANPLWLYFGAVAGVLLSPIHLCIVLTANYFQTDLYRTLLRMVPLLTICGIIAFWIANLF